MQKNQNCGEKKPAFLLRRGKYHSICFYSASNRTIMCLLLFSCIIITKLLKVLLCIGRFSCRGAVAQNEGMILPPQSYPEKFPSSTSVPLVTTSVTMAKKPPTTVKEKTIKWIWAPFKSQPFVYWTFKIFLDVDFHNEVHMKISFLSLHVNDYTIVLLSGLLIYKIHLEVVPVLF